LKGEVADAICTLQSVLANATFSMLANSKERRILRIKKF
jgi:hypothetical protein